MSSDYFPLHFPRIGEGGVALLGIAPHVEDGEGGAEQAEEGEQYEMDEALAEGAADEDGQEGTHDGHHDHVEVDLAQVVAHM